MPTPPAPQFTEPADSIVYLNQPLAWTHEIPALAAGLATINDTGADTVDVSAADATGGIGDYVYQWQRYTGGVWVDVEGAGALTETGLETDNGDKFRLMYTDRRGEAIYSNELTVSLITTVVWDDFTGTNGDLVQGRAPNLINTTGNLWQTIFGTATIGTGGVVLFGNTSSAISHNSGLSDGVFQGSVTHGSASSRNPRFIFRGNGTTANRWYVQLTAGTGATLVEMVASTGTVRDSETMTIANDTQYAIMVVLNGSLIDVYIAGVLKLSYNSATHQSNTHGGFGCTSNSGVKADHYKVDPL